MAFCITKTIFAYHRRILDISYSWPMAIRPPDTLHTQNHCRDSQVTTGRIGAWTFTITVEDYCMPAEQGWSNKTIERSSTTGIPTAVMGLNSYGFHHLPSWDEVWFRLCSHRCWSILKTHPHQSFPMDRHSDGRSRKFLSQHIQSSRSIGLHCLRQRSKIYFEILNPSNDMLRDPTENDYE